MLRRNLDHRPLELGKMKETGEESSAKIMPCQFSDVYDVLADIGRGNFAVVKRCAHKKSGIEYAAKFLKKRRKGKDCKIDVLHEVHMLELAVSHPRIISLFEVYETSHDLIIVTDFAKGGELFEYIHSEGQLEEKVTVRLMRQIVDGIMFLHTNNIAHLDVKPQNILLTDALPGGDIKLCDFGLARLINCGHDILEILGTPDYVAPEVLDYKPLNSACDMWSVGVLAYVMLTGCSPFAGDTTQETYLNISQVNLDFPEELFENVSNDAIDFMQSVLIKSPKDRLTARQSLEHVWLQKHEPVVPTISIESPSGQRRSVLATNNPDFHKPIKKSRCELKLTLGEEKFQKSDSCPIGAAKGNVSSAVLTLRKSDSCAADAEKENVSSTTQTHDKSSVVIASKPVSKSIDNLLSRESNKIRVPAEAVEKTHDNVPKQNFISCSKLIAVAETVEKSHDSLPKQNFKSCGEQRHRSQINISYVKDNREPMRRDLGEVTV